MTIANWTDLQSAVTNWLAHSNLSARYGEFATLFEAKANRWLRVRQMETTNTVSTVAGTATIALPSDYLEARHLQLNTTPVQLLKPASLDILRTQYDTAANGRPKVFAIQGYNIVLGPVPDSDYSTTLIYYQSIPGIESNNTNWLLTKYPDYYLFGLLAEAANYDNDPEGEARYIARRDGIFNEIAKDDNGAKWNSRPSIEVRGWTP